MVTDPILLFLTINAVALIMLGAAAASMPPAITAFLITGLSGLAAILCLPPLIFDMPPGLLELPAGPPGLSLQLALDPLAGIFLVITCIATTAIAAFQALTPHFTTPANLRITAFCLAGAIISVLAADAITLALGLSLICAALFNRPALSTPLLALAAICALTPPGSLPQFEAIRTLPADPLHTAAAALFGVAATTILLNQAAKGRSWIGQSLSAAAVIPTAAYSLLRILTDLSASTGQVWWGFTLLLIGTALAAIQSWHAAARADLNEAIDRLLKRQAGLTLAAIGLVLIARAADLAGAASFAAAATFLLILGSAIAGTTVSLTASAISDSAGTTRISRLGGLIHTMPQTSAALAAGMLTLSALPPGLGFASLWLTFQAILSAQRTGGLLAQLPLALAAALIALSAALASTASVRLIGVILLGRPRTFRGSGAQDASWPTRIILLALAGLSLVFSILPGPILWLLAQPAIQLATGSPMTMRLGLALLPSATGGPGFMVLPTLALLAGSIGVVVLVRRQFSKSTRITGPWLGGEPPPYGLPFGEPAAQSTGEGFLPILPTLQLPVMPSLPMPRPVTAITGLWIVLCGFGILLLALALAA